MHNCVLNLLYLIYKILVNNQFCHLFQNWEITMIRDRAKTKFGCRVGRPSGMSYLFFQSFSLQLSGAKAEKAKVLVIHFLHVG